MLQISSKPPPVMQQMTEPKNVQEALVEAGILPTFKQARERFWSLGDNWWMQIIDGMYHKHGKWVFDRGLHRGPTEPGYLNNIENGCCYFIEHFDGPLTVELYKKTHHEACAHFSRSSATGVCCDFKEIDHFRTHRTTSNYPFTLKIITEAEKTRQVFKKARKMTLEKGHARYPKQFKAQWERFVLPAFALLHQPAGKSEEDLSALLIQKYEDLSHSQKQVASEHVDKLNELFEQIGQRLGMEPFVICGYVEEDFSCFLRYRESSEIYSHLGKLFKEFNQNLDEAQREAYSKLTTQDVGTIKSEYQERAIFLIGRLFAELEWLHPWIDGQGRTDLIYLNGLLCREGLHPCILDFPYFSSVNPLDAWIEYLKGGLAQFELQ